MIRTINIVIWNLKGLTHLSGSQKARFWYDKKISDVDLYYIQEVKCSRCEQLNYLMHDSSHIIDVHAMEMKSLIILPNKWKMIEFGSQRDGKLSWMKLKMKEENWNHINSCAWWNGK